EFRKVAILKLKSPGNLQQNLLEHAIALAAQSRLTVAGRAAEPKWESHNESDISWRQLDLPLLGWEICYAIADSKLIFANSNQLLREVLRSSDSRHVLNESFAGFDEMTIIRLDQRKTAFDDVMKLLDTGAISSQAQEDANKTSEEFFSGNIGSLLNVASDV